MKSLKKYLATIALCLSFTAPASANEISLYDAVVNYFFGGMVVSRHGDNKPDPTSETVGATHGDNKPDPGEEG